MNMHPDSTTGPNSSNEQSKDDSLVDSIAPEIATYTRLSLTELGREFEDPKPQARLAVLRAVARCDVADPAALEILIRALRDSDRRLRLHSASMLGRLGPSAEIALPALIELFRETDRRILDFSYTAVRNVGAPAIPLLRDALRHEDRRARIGALRSLGRLGVAAESVMPDLLQIVRADGDLRADAIATLSLIGPAAAVAIPDLLSALDDRDDDVRRWATEALWKIGEPANGPLRKALTDERLSVRVRSAFALTKLEPNLPEIIPVLEDGLSAPDKWLRRRSAELLGELASADPGPIARLRWMRMNDPEKLIRKSAKDALRVLRKRHGLSNDQDDQLETPFPGELRRSGAPGND